MPISECKHCDGSYQWHLEEAFCKFGFGDGDGQIETYNVQNGFIDAGYEVEILEWGMHNTIIVSLKKDEIEQILDTVRIGYDHPRTYLPSDVLRVLDGKFKSETPYVF